MGAKIYNTDDVDTMAEKIYRTFERGDTVSIFGWVEEGETLVPKGVRVLDKLLWFYQRDHYGHKGRAREFKYRKDTIGGPIAHPIWSWEKRMVDQEPRINIWRIQ